jgi:hypothetical protein
VPEAEGFLSGRPRGTGRAGVNTYRKIPLLLAATLTGLVPAGHSVGPVVLRANGAQYNQAVQRGANEQLLLDLVRLKYREPMAFLQIGSISSHFDYSASASVSGAWPETGVESYGAAVGGSYSEQPTLTDLEGRLRPPEHRLGPSIEGGADGEAPAHHPRVALRGPERGNPS